MNVQKNNLGRDFRQKNKNALMSFQNAGGISHIDKDYDSDYGKMGNGSLFEDTN